MTYHEYGKENEKVIMLIHPEVVMWDWFSIRSLSRNRLPNGWQFIHDKTYHMWSLYIIETTTLIC